LYATLNEHPANFKQQDIQCKISNWQPHITAHLQGTQNPTHKPNLAKELQSPTHGIHPLVRHIN
jgi:hypothetical protein